MAAGLILMDLLWAGGLFGLALLSVTSALAVAALIAPATPTTTALTITIAATTALVTWIATCALLLFILPKPRPGTYRMLQGRDFYAWALGFTVRRWLDLPPMGILYRQSAVLRFAILRMAGAKIAFSAQLSSDVVLLDPGLLELGPGAMVGSQTSIAGHFILGDRLVLAPVVIKAGAQVAIDVLLGPGVIIGHNATIQARASISPECIIGAGAQIGALAALGRGVSVGDGARVPMASVVPARSHIAANSTWPPPETP